MELKDLRNEIDILDEEILEKFQQRMNLCMQVAEFKRQNKINVFQGGRENEVLDRIRQMAEPEFEESAAVLFSNIMDISKSFQQCEINKNKKYISYETLKYTSDAKIGCYGVRGSNSEEAARKIVGDCKDIKFYHEFDDVFTAIDSGEIDFGVVPVQNSSTGSIAQTYDLMKKYNVYINKMVRVSIKHCLAAVNVNDIGEIEAIYSHPQALQQCSEFIRNNNLKTVHYASTASSAKFVSKSDKKLAAICSERCANIYKMKILKTNISDETSNYTRFICFSKKSLIEKGADRISVLMSLSNEEGSLYRMLTKFRVAGLNLVKIESRPLHKGNFDVTFYLDFEGSIDNNRVNALLIELNNELSDFKFLGNYSELL